MNAKRVTVTTSQKYLYLGCECYSAGTVTSSNVLKMPTVPNGPNVQKTCDNTTGICNCGDGYMGPKCNRCSSGYYNENNNSSAPECSCMLSSKWIVNYMSISFDT